MLLALFDTAGVLRLFTSLALVNRKGCVDAATRRCITLNVKPQTWRALPGLLLWIVAVLVRA